MSEDRSAFLQALPWDTEHFGFGVARWQGDPPQPGALQLAHRDGLASGLRLVYVHLPPDEVAAESALLTVGAQLVDRKTNFAKALDPAQAWPPEVTVYARPTVSADLLELAYASGAFSRYVVDPRMPRECFKTLYRLWIERSVAGEIADAVLVVAGEPGEDAMVTVKADAAGVARIGLIAVAERRRGQGLASKLLQAAEAWAVRHGCQRMEVVTQGDNAPAVALYRRGGYAVDWTQHVWHWWL